jgi:hypothetical protein
MVNMAQTEFYAHWQYPKGGVMQNLEKKTTTSRAGNAVLRPTLLLASCLSLFLVTVRFHLDGVLLCALDHLVP